LSDTLAEPRSFGRRASIAIGKAVTGRRTLLALILVAGGALRFIALDYGGAGFEARPDEYAVAGTLMWPPELPILPPSLVLYGGGYFLPLSGFVRAVAFAGGPRLRVVDRAPTLDSIVVVRTWSAIVATLTIPITYLVGRRVGGPAAGLIAAAILAASPLAVREAHAAKADSAAAFAAALVLLALTSRGGTGLRRAAVIGAATGLALGTKALLGLVPASLLGLWAAAQNGEREHGRGSVVLVGLAVLVVVTLVCDWYVLVSPRSAFEAIRTLAPLTMDARWLPGADQVPGPFAYHTTVSLRHGVGVGVALLAPPALVVALLRGGGSQLVAVAVLGLFAVLLSMTMVLARFFLPCLPGLVVLVACLVVRIAKSVPTSPRVVRVSLVAASLLLVAEPAGNSVALVRLLARPDTRREAGEWLQKNLKPGARVATWGAPQGAEEFGLPPLRELQVLHRLPAARWVSDQVQWVVWQQYPLPYSDAPPPVVPPEFAPAAVFEPFSGAASPILEPLDAFYVPLAHFGGVTRPGPRIVIFRRRPQSLMLDGRSAE
jgi:hypothetical protein